MKWNVEPLFGPLDVAHMLPPWSSMMPLQMLSPSPTLFWDTMGRSMSGNGVNSLFMSASCSPIPWSFMVNVISLSVFSIFKLIFESSGLYFEALSSRLTNT